MHLNVIRRMAVALATTAMLTTCGSPAPASEPYAKRGKPCAVVGEERRDRSGDWYVCEQRAADPCPVWHAQDPKRGPWPSRKPPQCPTCTATPSASSPGPTGGAGAAGTATTPDASSGTTADTLPVTGPSTGYILGLGLIGLAFVVIGTVAIAAGRRRNDP